MFNAQNALYSDKNTFCIKNTEVFYWVIVGSVLFQSPKFDSPICFLDR